MESVQQESNRLLINFCGDVLLGEMPENYKRGIKTRIREKGMNPLYFVNNKLADADLNVINLECVLSDTSERQKPFSEFLRATPDTVRILVENHIHAANIANNHTLDHGIKAFRQTRDLLLENGIQPFGEHRDAFQNEPVIIEKKGIKLAFLGYYLEETLPYDEFIRLTETIGRLVEKTKKQGYLVVLSLHWGHEYIHFPTSPMINAGKHFMECGADIIYGHHSHRLNGAVMYRNSLFAPSLGNFVFEDILPENRITAILQVQLDERGVINHTLIPCFINRKFQPVPAPKHSAYINRLNELLSILLEDKQYVEKYDRKARKMIKHGHLINRLKIRFMVLLRFYVYIAFFKTLLKHTFRK